MQTTSKIAKIQIDKYIYNTQLDIHTYAKIKVILLPQIYVNVCTSLAIIYLTYLAYYNYL